MFKTQSPLKDLLQGKNQLPVNKLIVEQAIVQDNPSVYMSSARMASLKIFKGDAVFLKGKIRAMTLAIVMVDQKLDESKIRMTKSVRKNLRVQVGDIVHIRNAGDVPNLYKIHILPIKDTIKGYKGDLVKEFLVPYFKDHYRPLKKGDYFTVYRHFKEIQFKVVATQPQQYGIVAPNTFIYTQGKPLDLQNQQKVVGYEDIGGYRSEMEQIKQIIYFNFKCPQVFENLGVRPPKAVLLTGPIGSGKTHIVKAIANETGAFFFLVNGPQIMSKMLGQAQKNLRLVFQQSQKNTPSIIFIDQIDAIAPKRQSIIKGQAQYRVVSQLLTLMDGLKTKSSNLLIFAATNQPQKIDPALKRFGRFDKIINIRAPNKNQRLQILKIQAKQMKLSENVDLKEISAATQDFVAADLTALCSEAALICIRENFSFQEIQDQNLIIDQMRITSITQKHFQEAISRVVRCQLKINMSQDHINNRTIQVSQTLTNEQKLKNGFYFAAGLLSGFTLAAFIYYRFVKK